MDVRRRPRIELVVVARLEVGAVVVEVGAGMAVGGDHGVTVHGHLHKRPDDGSHHTLSTVMQVGVQRRAPAVVEDGLG